MTGAWQTKLARSVACWNGELPPLKLILRLITLPTARDAELPRLVQLPVLPVLRIEQEREVAAIEPRLKALPCISVMVAPVLPSEFMLTACTRSPTALQLCGTCNTEVMAFD